MNTIEPEAEEAGPGAVMLDHVVCDPPEMSSVVNRFTACYLPHA